jgi:multidrug efflux pump subunit AcrA (membrane-fusion protein)
MRNKLSYLLHSAALTALAAGMVGAAEPAGAPAGGAGGAAAQVAAARPGANEPNGTERSFTKPSEERALAFSSPGLVVKVNVKQDEPIKVGQVLAEQDVSVEKANKAMYEIEANSAVEEEYAIADVELKKVELARKEKLFNQGNKAINQLELDEARLNVKRAEASVKIAQQKRQTAAAQAGIEQAKIDLKRIVSTVDGFVQKLDTQPGEVASSQIEKPAIRVVKSDPLWIDVNFPAATAAKIKPGQAMQVRYVTEENKWMKAQVLSLQPVVRSGSQVQTVRLVMPNPDGVPPGLEVYVKLPDATVADAAGARDPQAGGDR